MNNDAVAKITMIRHSMRSFTYGLIGLLPAIGLPFAILALWNARRARVLERQYWNVAKPHRRWGAAIAGLGAIFCSGPIVIWLGYNFVVVLKYAYYGSD